LGNLERTPKPSFGLVQVSRKEVQRPTEVAQPGLVGTTFESAAHAPRPSLVSAENHQICRCEHSRFTGLGVAAELGGPKEVIGGRRGGAAEKLGLRQLFELSCQVVVG
jgi:hypothetical protein